MKTALIALLLLIPACCFARKAKDTTQTDLPVISYQALDSLIKTNKYTAIYFWPTWCVPCNVHIDSLAQLMSRKKQISFYLVVEASSNNKIRKKLIGYPGVVNGCWRVESKMPKRLIAINDHSEMTYFHRHFGRTNPAYESVFPSFLLFDRNGKLVWYNAKSYKLHDIATALVNFKEE